MALDHHRREERGGIDRRRPHAIAAVVDPRTTGIRRTDTLERYRPTLPGREHEGIRSNASTLWPWDPARSSIRSGVITHDATTIVGATIERKDFTGPTDDPRVPETE